MNSQKQRDVTRQRLLKHNMTGTKEWRAWYEMCSRCLNPNNHAFADYGGRGITVHAAWQKSFSSFYAHIGAAPSSKHSLDRIDNSRGYEPGNVRWATKKEQANNRRPKVRDVKVISPDGKIYTVVGLCKFCAEHGLNRSSMNKVINGQRNSLYGWRIL